MGLEPTPCDPIMVTILGEQGIPRPRSRVVHGFVSPQHAKRQISPGTCIAVVRVRGCGRGWDRSRQGTHVWLWSGARWSCSRGWDRSRRGTHVWCGRVRGVVVGGTDPAGGHMYGCGRVRGVWSWVGPRSRRGTHVAVVGCEVWSWVGQISPGGTHGWLWSGCEVWSWVGRRSRRGTHVAVVGCEVRGVLGPIVGQIGYATEFPAGGCQIDWWRLVRRGGGGDSHWLPPPPHGSNSRR